jgi:hypothetical protein
MTTLVTQARLVGTVLRAGDGARIARLIHRFSTHELAGIIPALGGLQRRKLSAILVAEFRDHRILNQFDAPSLAMLVRSAAPADQSVLLSRLLSTEPHLTGSTLLEMQDVDRRKLLDAQPAPLRRELMRSLPMKVRSHLDVESFGAAFRLRRLFAS